MNSAEYLRAALPKKRSLEQAAVKIEDGTFQKDVYQRTDEHIQALSPQLTDLSAAGFIPHLLRTEELPNDQIRQYWEVVPGVDLREASATVRYSMATVLAVAELYFALQTYNLVHADAGAHNCMWVGPNTRFHSVVAIDLGDLEVNRRTPAVQVTDFAKTLFEAWVGADVMTIFEGLIFSGKIETFLPKTYPQLLREKEAGKLDLVKIQPIYAVELLKSVFEALHLYQNVDNRVLEFVLQAYSAEPPTFADLQHFYHILQKS